MEETSPDAPPNGEAKRRRAPQRKLTEEDRAALVELFKRPDLRKSDGSLDIGMIAKMSGASYNQVIAVAAKNPYFHAQVSEADPSKIIPTEANLADAPDIPTGITISNAQFDEYRALIRQNKKMLGADWQKLGMTEEAGKRMEHYATIGTAPTGMVLRVTTGQLISNLELLDRIIKADSERVLTGKLPEEKDKNGEARDPEEVERDWRYMVFAGMKLQLDMFGHVHKVQAMMARVMKDLYLMNGGSAPKAKGEFETQVTPVSERPQS